MVRVDWPSRPTQNRPFINEYEPVFGAYRDVAGCGASPKLDSYNYIIISSSEKAEPRITCRKRRWAVLCLCLSVALSRPVSLSLSLSVCLSHCLYVRTISCFALLRSTCMLRYCLHFCSADIAELRCILSIIETVNFALELDLQLSLLSLYLTNIGHHSLVTFVCAELLHQARTREVLSIESHAVTAQCIRRLQYVLRSS